VSGEAFSALGRGAADELQIQRNFTYATSDVREAYVQVKKALYDDKITKVVFVVHSQGCIEGGLIVDWLLAEVPQDRLSQLEIYTFGNAANHFNNPNRSANSALISTPSAPASSHTAIGHIEHYANVGDYVSQIGVLYFTSDAKLKNRFMGRLFKSPYSGHLLNEHYLHEMFPLDKSGTRCLDTNDFMEMKIDMVNAGISSTRFRTDQSVQDAQNGHGEIIEEVDFIGDVDSPVGPVQVLAESTHTTAMDWKVKNLSRLWLYRNGGTPPDETVQRANTL